ncbi:hypothetical protein Tco_0553125 [Tanacetum coccineum]
MAPRTFSTVHVPSPFHQAVKSRGKSQSKVKMDNSESRLEDDSGCKVVKIVISRPFLFGHKIARRLRGKGGESNKEGCLILLFLEGTGTHITSTNVSILRIARWQNPLWLFVRAGAPYSIGPPPSEMTQNGDPTNKSFHKGFIRLVQSHHGRAQSSIVNERERWIVTGCA